LLSFIKGTARRDRTLITPRLANPTDRCCQIEQCPVQWDGARCIDDRLREPLEVWIVTNIGQSAGPELTFQDPRGVYVEERLSSLVRKQYDGVGDVLANARKALKFLASPGKTPIAGDHLSRELPEAGRPSLPQPYRL
jgi:hypothetical protein